MKAYLWCYGDCELAQSFCHDECPWLKACFNEGFMRTIPERVWSIFAFASKVESLRLDFMAKHFVAIQAWRRRAQK